MPYIVKLGNNYFTVIAELNNRIDWQSDEKKAFIFPDDHLVDAEKIANPKKAEVIKVD